MRLLLTIIMTLPLVIAPAAADAFDLEQSLRDIAEPQHGQVPQDRIRPDYRIAQNGNGMSLSQAIESVRRQTGGQIVSAVTKVKNGRETHHIKVLTKDGKVRTFRFPGRSRNNG